MFKKHFWKQKTRNWEKGKNEPKEVLKRRKYFLFCAKSRMQTKRHPMY